jgi:alpha-tubulin suppressor-like RCC1 family protein
VFDNKNQTDLNSVADVKSSDSFSLALAEDGLNVYSWGRGIMGHLGNGSEITRVTPQKVNFNFTDEQKKINKVKKNGGSSESEVRDLLFFKNFLNNASKTKGSSNLAKT